MLLTTFKPDRIRVSNRFRFYAPSSTELSIATGGTISTRGLVTMSSTLVHGAVGGTTHLKKNRRIMPKALDLKPKNKFNTVGSFNVNSQAGYFCVEDGGACIANRIFRFEYDTLPESYAEISRITGLDCSIDGYQSMAYTAGDEVRKTTGTISKTSDVSRFFVEQRAIDFELWEESGKEIRTDYHL